ncbi:PfkB family carbohydrate kinase [Natronolimnohabitans innermongolicus]|uniref:Ribokinase n=1 Tax=Natronolimnohabitans innermongolicus JCM 12255 TaxID=1227499 RepID=L9WY00_9EURY|nr:PfkB family carbohydrate kinase [Natronolimnohabitans innermongolicus]ELY54036.1 ribokinase [Natronolimnohabitans innermongolicus JCM 12255]
MPDVVSFGSINVDRTWTLSTDRIGVLEQRYNWFPAAGETVRVDGDDRTELTALEERLTATLSADRQRTTIGGKGANQAVAAARATGKGAAMFGCVGADAAGDRAREALADRGVDADRIGVTDRPTGTASIFVDEVGESRIAIVGGANDAVDSDYVDRHFERLRRADALLLQNEIPVATATFLLERLADRTDGSRRRPTVICNPAPADGAASLLAHQSPLVDVVVVNETEYATLERSVDAFDGTVIRTQGPDDVVVRGDRSDRVSPPTVDPVDTTGAGDAFCGYLAAFLADGVGLESALTAATVAGSLTTETVGVQEAIPDRETVLDVLER